MNKLTSLFAIAALAATAGIAQARDLGPDEALKLRDAGTIQNFDKLNEAALAKQAAAASAVQESTIEQVDFAIEGAGAGGVNPSVAANLSAGGEQVDWSADAAQDWAADTGAAPAATSSWD